MRAFLSESLVARIKQNRSERIEIRDTKIPGFSLRIGKQRIAWYWRGRVDKKEVRVSLGVWPVTSADAARNLCIGWVQSHGQGVYAFTPHTIGLRDKGPTLQEAFEQYLERKPLRESSKKTYCKHMRLYLAELQERRLSGLTSHDVRTWYAALSRDTSVTKANNSLSLLKAVYGWVNVTQELGLPDIFKALQKSGEKQATPTRDDVLLDDHLRRIGESLAGLYGPYRNFFLLGLLTGFRLGELRSLTPRCVDFFAKTITLDVTKNGRKHILPLSTQLEVILASMCEGLAPDARFFGKNAQNYASVISRKTAVEFSAHTLRRTFASHATRIGISSYVVKALLNHFDGNDVTQTHYVRLQVDDLREPLALLTRHLCSLLGWQKIPAQPDGDCSY